MGLCSQKHIQRYQLSARDGPVPTDRRDAAAPGLKMSILTEQRLWMVLMGYDFLESPPSGLAAADGIRASLAWRIRPPIHIARTTPARI